MRRGDVTTWLALGTLVAGLLALAAPAAADDELPTWTVEVEGGDPYDGNVWIADQVLDAKSGDVFVLLHDGWQEQPKRVHRLDGATGAIEWETGVGPAMSGGMSLSLDPDGRRLTVLTDDGSWDATLHSLDLDGELQWSRALPDLGLLGGHETNPATGTTCLTSRRSALTPRRWSTWVLQCLDRAGRTVAEQRYRHRGRGKPSGLAVDPVRGRWYVAGTVRGSRGVVLAHDEADDGRLDRVWRRAVPRRGGQRVRVDSITVTERTGRVHVTGTEQHRDRIRGRLATWDRRGRSRHDRSWRTRLGGPVTVEADPRGRRLFTLQGGGFRPGVQLRVLRRDGRGVRVLRQDVRHRDVAATLEVDPRRRRVVVSGVSVAAYTWAGRPLWRDRSTRLLVAASSYDVRRGRHVVSASWYDDPGRPGGWVSAWR